MKVQFHLSPTNFKLHVLSKHIFVGISISFKPEKLKDVIVRMDTSNKCSSVFCFQTPVSGFHKFQSRWVIFVKSLAPCFIIYSLDVFPFKQRGRLSSSWGTWRVREVQRPWFKSLQCSQQAITFTCDRRLSASNTGHSLRRLVQITFYYLGPLEGPKLRLLLILMEFQLGH